MKKQLEKFLDLIKLSEINKKDPEYIINNWDLFKVQELLYYYTYNDLELIQTFIIKEYNRTKSKKLIKVIFELFYYYISEKYYHSMYLFVSSIEEEYTDYKNFFSVYKKFLRDKYITYHAYTLTPDNDYYYFFVNERYDFSINESNTESQQFIKDFDIEDKFIMNNFYNLHTFFDDRDSTLEDSMEQYLFNEDEKSLEYIKANINIYSSKQLLILTQFIYKITRLLLEDNTSDYNYDERDAILDMLVEKIEPIFKSYIDNIDNYSHFAVFRIGSLLSALYNLKTIRQKDDKQATIENIKSYLLYTKILMSKNMHLVSLPTFYKYVQNMIEIKNLTIYYNITYMDLKEEIFNTYNEMMQQYTLYYVHMMPNKNIIFNNYKDEADVMNNFQTSMLFAGYSLFNDMFPVTSSLNKKLNKKSFEYIKSVWGYGHEPEYIELNYFSRNI